MKLTYNTQPKKPIDMDSMYDEAVKLVQETGKASSSLIQRKLKLGYARSAYLLDQMEQNGIVGPADGVKPREILIPHNVDGEMVIPKKQPEIIKEETPEELVSWKKTKYADNKTNGFEIEIGLDKNNKKVNLDLSKYQNLLVIGNKFTGVSDFLNNVLAVSLAKYSPDELRVITMDGVRNDLIVPNQIPHLLVPKIVDLEKGISALKWAVAEVERRLKTFSEVGDQDIRKWNENTGFQAMPNILILINSLEQFLLFSSAEMEDNLCRLMLTGKKAGVFFVMGVDPIVLRKYKSILSNNAAKLVFKTVDKSTAKSFGAPESIDLNSPDKAILNVLFEDNKEIEIEKTEVKKIYEEIFE